MAGPLSNIRILDLTHVWAGPLAVRFLSDLGAEVVKVEAPGGRGPREAAYSPLGGWMGGTPGDEPWNANALFVKLHRNRSSLCIDLKSETGRNTFLKMVGVADIVIENFSARAMPAMKLDYGVLKQANPNIIYVTMPGYGTTGPYRDRVAFGPTVEPLSGLTTVLGYSADEPRNSAIALMDPVCATNTAAAVTAALRQREREKTGSRVELSLHEGGVAYSGPWLLDQQLDKAPVSMANRHPRMAPHGVFQCAGEDNWVAISCATQSHWQQLAPIIGYGDPDWNLPERQQHNHNIEQAISGWTRSRDKQKAAAELQAASIAAGAVNTTPDMLADEQVKARGFFVPYEVFDTPMPGNSLQMTGIDRETWTPCPGLGADNHEVLSSWLGMTDDEISALEASSIIFDAPPA